MAGHTDTTPGSQKRIQVAERVANVMALRRQHLTFEQIGQQLDPQHPVSRQRIEQLYRKGLAAIPSPDIELLRLEQTTLADTATAELLALVEREKFRNPRAAIEALKVLCAWSERLSHLHGLDAPLRAEFSNMTGQQLDAEIHRLEIEVAAQRPIAEIEAAPADRADGGADDSSDADADADADASSNESFDDPERGHFIPAIDPAVAVRRRALEPQAPDWSSAYRQQPAKPADGAS